MLIKFFMSSQIHSCSKQHQAHFRMNQEGEIFQFPLSREGLEWFQTVQQMKSTFGKQFQKLYGRNKNIKSFNVHVRYCNSLSSLARQYSAKFNRTVRQIWRIKCSICSNVILYCNFLGSKGYWLASINFYHIHTNNRQKYIQFLGQNSKFSQIINEIFQQQGEVQIVDEKQKQAHFVKFLQSLPHGIRKNTKFLIMNSNFGIDQDYFNRLISKGNPNLEISFKELIEKFKEEGYTYSMLPHNFLKNEEPDIKIMQKQCSGTRIQEIIDSKNPHLPNILVIVTPQMKEQYRLFGAFVGFDLTFSVIRERSSRDCEYMIGVFAGTNGSKRIVIFGLTITNSQSVFAYKFIFKEFFRLIGGEPPVVVTDQEMAMHHALMELKKQGNYHGQHFFDMFHILRKYRKGSSQSKTFQIIRQLIHAKDKQQYKKILRQAMASITNDKQLELLRNFDLNSENFCYSQIHPTFVGIGVSNSPNQYFHHCIKNNITHAAKYTKAVQMTLDVIHKRKQVVNTPVLIFTPYHKIFNLPFMQPLRNVVSDKAYFYILKELKKNPNQKILNTKEENQRNLQKQTQQIDKNHYYVQDENGIYLVYRQQKILKNGLINHSKWNCLCELQNKSGYLCSHIGKVLIAHNQNFNQNIIDRWMINLVPMASPSYEFFTMRMNKKTIKKVYLDPTNGKFAEMGTGMEEEQLDNQGQEDSRRESTVTNEPLFQNQSGIAQQWSDESQGQYLLFLKNNRQQFKGTKNDQLPKKFYKKMSKSIGSKSKQQCRLFHDYLIKKHHTIDNVLKKYSDLLKKAINYDEDEIKIQELDQNQANYGSAVSKQSLGKYNLIKRKGHEDDSQMQQHDFLMNFKAN